MLILEILVEKNRNVLYVGYIFETPLNWIGPHEKSVPLLD
jgi:hypothetical protein